MLNLGTCHERGERRAATIPCRVVTLHWLLGTALAPTLQAYVLTTLLGLSLTLGIEAWQYFLPSRVADINDVIWNSAGTLLGALLGHARLRVRFDFE